MSVKIDPLDDIDLSVIAAIRTGGSLGIPTRDVGAKLGASNTSVAVASFLKRARKRGYDIITLHVGRRGNANLFRYAMADAVEVASAPGAIASSLCDEFGIRVAQRAVKHDPMLSTCALISVAYLSFLDGAPASRALDGEGSR